MIEIFIAAPNPVNIYKNIWSFYVRVKFLVSSHPTDIVHRDLKLENILVKNSPDKDGDKIDVKVKCWTKLRAFHKCILSILCHTEKKPQIGTFSSPTVSSIVSKGFKYYLIMIVSLWSSFIVHLYKWSLNCVFKQMTCWAQHVACIDGEPDKADTWCMS